MSKTCCVSGCLSSSSIKCQDSFHREGDFIDESGNTYTLVSRGVLPSLGLPDICEKDPSTYVFLTNDSDDSDDESVEYVIDSEVKDISDVEDNNQVYPTEESLISNSKFIENSRFVLRHFHTYSAAEKKSKCRQLETDKRNLKIKLAHLNKKLIRMSNALKESSAVKKVKSDTKLKKKSQNDKPPLDLSSKVVENNYSEELKSYACSVYYNSPTAYDRVKKIFGDALPEPAVVKRWLPEAKTELGLKKITHLKTDEDIIKSIPLIKVTPNIPEPVTDITPITKPPINAPPEDEIKYLHEIIRQKDVIIDELRSRNVELHVKIKKTEETLRTKK